MALNKYSYESDVAGNLYKAAFYLAKGSSSVAMYFLKKSREDFNDLKIDSKKDKLFWAEKILDQYTKLKYSL